MSAQSLSINIVNHFVTGWRSHILLEDYSSWLSEKGHIVLLKGTL